MDQVDGEQREIYQKEMKTRRIPIRPRPDILRWGYTVKGNFMIKEAYHLLTPREPDDMAVNWKQNMDQ